MNTHQYTQKKPLANMPAPRSHNGFATCGFTVQTKPDKESDQQNQPPPDLKTQLDRATRFGHNLSQISVHTSSQSMAAVQTKATLTGQGNQAIQRQEALLGHKLTHLIQQRTGRVPVPYQIKGISINADPVPETEADQTEAWAASGGGVQVPGETDGMEISSASPVQNSTQPVQLSGKGKGKQRRSSSSPSPRRGRTTSPGGTVRTHSPGGRTYRQRSPSGRYNSKKRRDAAGFVNPNHSHKNMLPHWIKALLKPLRTGLTNPQKRKHLMDKNTQYRATSPGKSSQTIITGHSKGVLGHDESAGANWNKEGHTRSRSENLEHNRQTSIYHGIEDASSSAASGSREPRYNSPAPDLESHRSYWDRNDPGFQGGPWHSWELDPSSSSSSRGRKRTRSTSPSPSRSSSRGRKRTRSTSPSPSRSSSRGRKRTRSRRR